MWEFSCRAEVRHVGPGVVELLRDLGYYGSAGTFVVKRGFLSDGASIPRLFWTTVGHPLSAEYLESAILHDALARSGLYGPREADEVMHEAMIAQETPQETINSIMLGLRISRPWRRKVPLDPRSGDYLSVTLAGNRRVLDYEY